MNTKQNTAYYLFSRFFLQAHTVNIVNYAVLTLIQNIAFLTCIMALVSASEQAAPNLTGFNIDLFPEQLLVLGAGSYFVCYILSLYLQFWLANRFSINLNLDLNNIYNFADIQSNSLITVSMIIKDVTYEFARFGTNLILPILDIFKHVITLSIIIVFLVISYPDIVSPVLLLCVPYILFWLFSKSYFQKTSVLISASLADRQRFADKQYTDINARSKNGRKNYVKESFEIVIKKIANYNVVSKTIASAPRVTLETIIIIGALLLVLNDNSDQSVLLAVGLSALRVLPGLQGISAAISNVQLSWPAMHEYAQRREAIREWNVSSEIHANEKFPSFIDECNFDSEAKHIQFVICDPLDLSRPGLYLLKGESGIGKSTFVRILAGLEPISRHDGEWKQGRSNVMFMDQHEQLLTGTVEENFIDLLDDKNLIMLQETWSTFFDKKRFQTFDDFMKAKIGGNSGLSGGEIKRLKLLRHLLSSENVLVWDEPFDGIQIQLVKKIVEHIRVTQINRRILIIDHNILDTNDVDFVIKLSKSGDIEVKVALENEVISN